MLERERERDREDERLCVYDVCIVYMELIVEVRLQRGSWYGGTNSKVQRRPKVKVKVNNKLSYWSSLASMVGKVGTLRQKVNGKCDWLKGEKPGGRDGIFKVVRLPSSSQGFLINSAPHLATQRTY